MKIAIVGLGGVGGYFAAQTTLYFKEREDIQFYYIARGEHLKAIKESGLKLERDGCAAVVAHPSICSDTTSNCGIVDYVIYATKSYSIEQSIEQLRAITDKRSTIITFMNGVDGAEKLRRALPDVTILEGCVFIYSFISSPGVIRESGGLAHYQIGYDKSGDNPAAEQRAKEFFDLMSAAVDKISCFDDITTRIWSKFSYISPYATISTHYNITSDEILYDTHYHDIYRALCSEFSQVAKALGIKLDFDIYERNIELIKTLPPHTTSSMQRDYYGGKMCEVESLTTFISRSARQHSIATPHYDKASEDISSKGN